jgi:hypothetical protein
MAKEGCKGKERNSFLFCSLGDFGEEKGDENGRTGWR